MRQTAAALNRGWLIVIGLVLLLAGLAGALISTGAAAWLLDRSGLSLPLPAADAHVVGSRTASTLSLTWVIVVVGVVGVVLALLGVAWLIAQVPRSNAAKPFRLHDDASTGLTRCVPDVLSDAVEKQIERLPGVHRASAVVRGTVSAPELAIKITAGDRTELQHLIAQIQDRVVADFCRSLDVDLHRLALRFEVLNASTSAHEVTF